MPEYQIFTLELKDEGLRILSIHDSVGSFSDTEIFKELEQLLPLLNADNNTEVVPNLVVDFEGVEYFGSSFLEAMRGIWMGWISS